MAIVNYYMPYTLFFHEQAEADFARSVAGGSYFKMAPRDAAVMFGIPYPYPSGDIASIPRGILFYAPFTPGVHIFYPNDSGISVNDAVLSTLVPGQASNTGAVGPDGNFTWSGTIICYNGVVAASYANIPRRRFTVGFEAQGSQEPGGSTLGTKAISRDAARVNNGFGLAIRKPASAINQQVAINTVVTPTQPYDSWDRFYFRLRDALPLNDTYIFFAAGGSTPTQMQARVRADAVGTLSLINYNGTTNTVVGSSQVLDLEKWYKIDIITDWNFLPTGGTGRLRMFVNGVLKADAFVSTGMGANNPVTGHVYSRLGVGTEGNIGAFNGINCDFDDWTNAEVPAIAGIESLTSWDWQIGTHIREHYVIADGAGRTGWGTLPAMVGNQQRNANTTFVTASNAFTTTTGLALLDLLTDITEIQENFGVSIGVGSVIVTTNVIDPDVAGTGSLGYSAVGVQTLTGIVDTSTGTKLAQYSPTGRQIPGSVVPFDVQYQKANTANQVQALSLYPYAEYIGVFEACDDSTGQTPIIPKFTHNSPYFNTVFGQVPLAGPSAVFMYGNTYVGNGTQQEIVLPCPVHFVWIRATGGVGVTPVNWFSWMWGGHRHAQEGSNDFEPIRICYDPVAQVFKMTIAASGTTFLNNSGTTYQIIAFSDVGGRYMLNDAVAAQAAAITYQRPIIDTLFNPDAGFFGYENATTTTTNNIWYKGSGNTANDANQLTAGGTQAGIGGFTIGQVTIDTALNNKSTVCKGYSAWRLNDGSGQVAWQRTNYTGNGAGGNRDINLPLTSGRWPLWALVCPHNAVAWYRDPTHAGSNSSQYGASTDGGSTAIVGGGIDKITVGTTLNANGVVYDVFVIMGNPSGWLNGLYWPYNYYGGGTEFITPPNPPPGVAVFGEGGLILGGSTAFTVLKDVSGIYRIVPGQKHDEVYDRNVSPVTIINLQIPNPFFKTGFIGG